jgi:hypothetical protein
MTKTKRRRQTVMMARIAIALLFLVLSCCTTAATAAVTSNDRSIEAEADYYLRGIRSAETEPPQQQEASALPTQPQPQHVPHPQHVPLGSDKLKLRQKNKKGKPPSSNPLQTFAHNMLTNQGCTSPTSTCGDICYVLTIATASDLHSVVIGTSDHLSHHWHDPTSFWRTGVCNAKSQCIAVNPFDRHHNFDDLANTLADVERECERSVGMAAMFVLAKAMEGGGVKSASKVKI